MIKRRHSTNLRQARLWVMDWRNNGSHAIDPSVAAGGWKRADCIHFVFILSLGP
jgi:hypothetical protein